MRRRSLRVQLVNPDDLSFDDRLALVDGLLGEDPFEGGRGLARLLGYGDVQALALRMVLTHAEESLAATGGKGRSKDSPEAREVIGHPWGTGLGSRFLWTLMAGVVLGWERRDPFIARMRRCVEGMLAEADLRSAPAAPAGPGTVGDRPEANRGPT